ncbi:MULTISPECIES: helix-turn-helix transcriptional regulator [unclassified Streptomyces]|uniref:helix-turn-helix domain-containing protein n=1 Tax=unclassified Streptomyces TaxID=2593676 RepID=UPI0008815ADE|nr:MULTISPECIES: helix-turn-helix transcriptional regulator [unclassified Streptomyces]PBC87079.1 helix-turn-helix protein [Streptomyces sp. 2321.6]SDQ62242.1 Helix-turn-helix domain-containing protein [Streptomyces sp. KS_16]SEE18576.1 Helix-turn-helix domain-containing protein [Streptomyces sp. 2133.1]SNC74254.1 Helix-turn-helix domain-containing protein [Streptomyces sp. 2114.4]
MSEAQPNMMRRRLGGALKTLRQRTGMNLDDAAARIGLPSGSTLSKVENAKRLVSTTALDAYFTAYGVGANDARRDEIRKLATLAGSTRRANLLRQYGDAVPDPFADYLELEDLAAQADIYASQVIPGILQTHDYAQAVIDGSRRWRTEREAKTFAELRMQRAAVLTRPTPLPVWCVLDEAALRRAMGGPPVLAEQLGHLLTLQETLPHLQLQVLPFAAGAHPAMDGTHTIFRFDAGGPVVVVEPMTKSLYLEEDADVGQYDVNFNHLRSQALDTKRSRTFIRDVIKEIR